MNEEVSGSRFGRYDRVHSVTPSMKTEMLVLLLYIHVIVES